MDAASKIRLNLTGGRKIRLPNFAPTTTIGTSFRLIDRTWISPRKSNRSYCLRGASRWNTERPDIGMNP